MYSLLEFIEKVEDTNARLRRLKTSINKFVNENSVLINKIMFGEEVLVSDFLKLYDTRIYDIHSRQEDIKYMKELDFEGLYYIQNLTKGMCYLGSGANVFRKVDRQFRGYGNKDIFADYNKKHTFVVSFYKLENSGFDSLSEFEKETRLRLNIIGVGYQKNNNFIEPTKRKKKNKFGDFIFDCIILGLLCWLLSMLI